MQCNVMQCNSIMYLLLCPVPLLWPSIKIIFCVVLWMTAFLRWQQCSGLSSVGWWSSCTCCLSSWLPCTAACWGLIRWWRGWGPWRGSWRGGCSTARSWCCPLDRWRRWRCWPPPRPRWVCSPWWSCWGETLALPSSSRLTPTWCRSKVQTIWLMLEITSEEKLIFLSGDRESDKPRNVPSKAEEKSGDDVDCAGEAGKPAK